MEAEYYERKCSDFFFRAVAAGIAIAIGGTVYLSVENNDCGITDFLQLGCMP